MRRAVVVVACAIALTLIVAAPASAETYGLARVIGGFGTADGQFNTPQGVTVGPDGTLYATDWFNSRVQVFAPDGSFKRKWAVSGPADVAVTDSGVVYVVRYTADRVEVFNASGTKIDQFGGSGSGNGQLDAPLGIALDADGFVYVADRLNNRIEKFDAGGNYVAQWAVSRPHGVAVSDDGRVYVTSSTLDRVFIYDTQGASKGYWGGFGTAKGLFNDPTGVDVDVLGNVYVVDEYNNRIQKFKPDGTYITQWGSGGTDPGEFDRPFSLCVGPARNVYVSDQYNHRVQEFMSPLPTDVTAVAGNNRFTTAIAASQKAFPDGLENDLDGRKVVVVATARNWPDALGGAALAGVLDAPILLVDSTSVPSAVATEIQRLGTQHVIILGGTSAVSAGVFEALSKLPGITLVTRLGGADRYATANLIAEKVVEYQGGGYDGHAILATGLNFPDALAVSPLAAYRGWPIYLTKPNDLPSSVSRAMADAGVTDVHIVGGTSAVGSAVISELGAIPSVARHSRISGANRYATAIAIAQESVGYGLSFTRLALATGLNFPDALAGGALQGRDGSVLLLTSGTSLEPAVASVIKGNRAAIYEMRYLGGAAAVTRAVRASVGALLY